VAACEAIEQRFQRRHLDTSSGGEIQRVKDQEGVSPLPEGPEGNLAAKVIHQREIGRQTVHRDHLFAL
jgi:hypothetical protein